MKKFLTQNHVWYGIIMTKLTALFVLIMHFTGQYSNLEEVGRSSIELLFITLVPLIIWYLGIKAKKDSQKGKLTFKEGMKEGFKIALVYGVTSPFVYVLYYLLLNSSILSWMKKEYMLGDVSDQVVILVDMVAQFVAAIIGGSLYSAIISFFLKSKSSK